MILTCAGIYIIVDYITRRENLAFICGMFLSWAIVFGFYYRYFIYNHPLKQLMLAYWIKAGGFMPFNKALPVWVVNKFVSNFYFQFYFGKAACVLLIILFFAGMFYLIRKRMSVGILLLLPMPLHLLLSGLKLYPFDTRLVLYLTPLLIISVAYGVYSLLQLLASTDKKNAIAIQLLIPIICFGLLIVQSFPLIRHDDLRQCISFMKDRAAKSDDVYVTLSARYPMEFYHDISFYSAHRILLGAYTPSAKLSDMDDRKKIGRLSDRVWVYCLKPYHEDAFINRFLIAAGYCPSASFAANGDAMVCLYILKNMRKTLPVNDAGHVIAKR